MRCVIIGLGIQGKKRLAIAGSEAVATVDPVAKDAAHRRIEDVPLDSYDAAFVCTPDAAKFPLLEYLLTRGKHVLVEKPLLAEDSRQIQALINISRSTGAACYTAYNHRFEPHIVRLKEIIDEGTLGEIYLARFFYGNGTARDVRHSPWRDKGMGVLADLGSHLLDLAHFLFAPLPEFRLWSCHRFENQAYDHCCFGHEGRPALQLETSLLSWRNAFALEVTGALGSAHLNGLCKWGPSTLTVRKRVFPSGKPREESVALECSDPTWRLEHDHFRGLCQEGETNLGNDLWINSVLGKLGKNTAREMAA